MRLSKSRTTALLTAAGAAFALCTMLGAPTPVAQPGPTGCQEGQVVIDGQCSVPAPVDPNMAPQIGPNMAPMNPTGGDTGALGRGGGGGGRGREPPCCHSQLPAYP